MNSLTATAPSFASLDGEMTGRVVTAADRDWDEIRSVFNLTTDLRPAAIALPRDVADVVATVRFRPRKRPQGRAAGDRP